MSQLASFYPEYYTLLKESNEVHLNGVRIKDMNMDDLKVTIMLLFQCKDDLHVIPDDYYPQQITHDKD